jgi:hypothetical protein
MFVNHFGTQKHQIKILFLKIQSEWSYFIKTFCCHFGQQWTPISKLNYLRFLPRSLVELLVNQVEETLFAKLQHITKYKEAKYESRNIF